MDSSSIFAVSSSRRFATVAVAFYSSGARARLTQTCARKPRWRGRGAGKNFGFFVSDVAHLTHERRNAGVTSRAEHAFPLRCAFRKRHPAQHSIGADSRKCIAVINESWSKRFRIGCSPSRDSAGLCGLGATACSGRVQDGAGACRPGPGRHGPALSFARATVGRRAARCTRGAQIARPPTVSGIPPTGCGVGL